jgi:hypothetical protein
MKVGSGIQNDLGRGNTEKQDGYPISLFYFFKISKLKILFRKNFQACCQVKLMSV